MLGNSNFKKIILCILLGVVGFYLGLISNNDKPLLNKIFTTISPIDYIATFKKIFFNNLIVGFFTSIIGFFTGGLITIVVFIWNGFTLGLLFKTLQNTNINATNIFINQVLPHAPTEIFAYCLFGCIGLKGHFFFKGILFESRLYLKHLPRIEEFILPTFLLFISAVIETFISS